MSRPKHTIAVISTHGDAHIPFVERHVDRPLLVLDPHDLIKGAALTFCLSDGNDRIIYNNEDLSAITGVWYRKPQPILQSDVPVKDNFKAYSQSAIERMALQLLTAFPHATWVSDYFSQSRANNKTLQMRLAQQIGFRVPPTIVTSDPKQAQKFIAQYKTSISKPLTITYPKIDGEQKLMLTTLIDSDFMPKLDNLHLAPSIFQQALDIAVEARVIVAGDKTFAASVRSEVPEPSDSIKHVRDNRVGHYEGSVHIEPINLPTDIARKCVTHTRKLGLNFGAIDLVKDKAGVWWFLENNPNGQWEYIEDATNQPIGKAIAELLIGL